jgi:hypothetical protein
VTVHCKLYGGQDSLGRYEATFEHTECCVVDSEGLRRSRGGNGPKRSAWQISRGSAAHAIHHEWWGCQYRLPCIRLSLFHSSAVLSLCFVFRSR